MRRCQSHTTISDLLAAGKNLVPASVGVSVLDPKQSPLGVLPEEMAQIPRAVAKRQREFAAGRAAVRRSMAAAGLQECAVGVGRDRAPVWPTNVFGSISHCADCAVAVSGNDPSILAIGVDVETNIALDRDLSDIICRPEEVAAFNSHDTVARGLIAKLIFSAKESAYKCQYTRTSKLIGFQDIRIEFTGDNTDFSAVFTKPVGSFNAGDQLDGKYSILHGVIMTCVIQYQNQFSQKRRTFVSPSCGLSNAQVSTEVLNLNHCGLTGDSERLSIG